jgi:periplasmic protein TonB
MTATPFPTSIGAHSTGWITSLLLHATLSFGAFVFTQQITLAPQPTPFKWNVAMVEPTPARTSNPAAASPPESSATPEKPLSSALLPRKSSSSATPQHQPASLTRSVRATPIPPPLSSPSQTSNEDSSLARPAAPVPAFTTPPTPSEPVAQERTAVRPVEPAAQPVHTESARVSSSHLQEPKGEVSQPSVTEPTSSTIPNASVKPESASEQQLIAMAPVPSSSLARPDYTWLSETILRRVEELKRYPAEARLDQAEGKVVLKAVIRGDGSVDDVEVHQSSGYRSLDHAAVELLKRAAPFQLPRPLGKSQMTVKIPMNYRLEQ